MTVWPTAMVLPALRATSKVFGFTSSLKVFLTLSPSVAGVVHELHINNEAPSPKFWPLMSNCLPAPEALEITGAGGPAPLMVKLPVMIGATIDPDLVPTVMRNRAVGA